jgi:hypothetical protein
MAVRVQDRWKRAFASAKRTIEIPRKVETGRRLEINLFDGVAVSLDFAKDLGMDGSFLGERPQAGTNQDLFADLMGTGLPFLQ